MIYRREFFSSKKRNLVFPWMYVQVLKTCVNKYISSYAFPDSCGNLMSPVQCINISNGLTDYKQNKFPSKTSVNALARTRWLKCMSVKQSELNVWRALFLSQKSESVKYLQVVPTMFKYLPLWSIMWTLSTRPTKLCRKINIFLHTLYIQLRICTNSMH